MGNGGARRSYLRVRNDAIFFEVGEKVASMDFAVVMAEIFVGGACFLVEKGGHSDHWLETHVFCDLCGMSDTDYFPVEIRRTSSALLIAWSPHP